MQLSLIETRTENVTRDLERNQQQAITQEKTQLKRSQNLSDQNKTDHNKTHCVRMSLAIALSFLDKLLMQSYESKVVVLLSKTCTLRVGYLRSKLICVKKKPCLMSEVADGNQRELVAPATFLTA
jgi:Mg2+/citrate symporter